MTGPNNKVSRKNNPFYGKKHSKEIMDKIIESRSWYAGSDKAKEAGRKISLANKDRPKPPRSAEHCEKISKANKCKIPWNKGMKMSKEFSDAVKAGQAKIGFSELMREKRLHEKFPSKDSKIEKMLQIALSLENISFIKHKPIIGQPDIFVEPNVCVFVDGCYWHGCSCRFPQLTEKQLNQIKRDNHVNHELNKLGYNVIRVYEHDIKSDVNLVGRNIIKLIKQSICGVNRIG